jgi:ubiquinone/menaquinone biosynthesis C-methylase UbiE
MATEFPECEFLCIDIFPLPPTTLLPRNCRFEQANVLEGIPRPDDWFDYVHQRFLVGAIPANQWKQHIQECTRICASDGWVEIIETSFQISDGGSACQQFNTWTTGGFRAYGIDLYRVQHLDELMHEAGLIHVTKQTVIAPIGPWRGETGELFAENYKLLSGSLQPYITNALGIPKEEIERNSALMMEEFKSHESYLEICIYFGQKP